MIRKLIFALAILTLTTTPALARGSGGGFHGGGRGEFHGRGFRDRDDRFERFDHFHRFGFVGPAFSFGVFPYFWDPFWFPSPYPAYTYAPPLVIQPESQEYIRSEE